MRNVVEQGRERDGGGRQDYMAAVCCVWVGQTCPADACRASTCACGCAFVGQATMEAEAGWEAAAGGRANVM